ncbi:hypothetical protein [Conexivisphaera calida]|uniref:Uncharacterized protein n=1 Tax=Conexivisphaera calida TaxID=1874277 RepID=A0A4P2VC10_9ARCH|nr:hypothetical protein [Conexivisphaera calida]BBE42044.1 hypothetical protein NAS2_0655 [Conexivisphaera calida]
MSDAIALSLVLALLLYIAFYRHDLLRFLHPVRATSWGRAPEALGIRAEVRDKYDPSPALVIAGAALAALDGLASMPTVTVMALGIAAGVVLFSGIVGLLGPPAIRPHAAASLRYPRPGRARANVERTELLSTGGGAGDSDLGELGEIDPRGAVFFYIAPKDGRAYSRPRCEPPGHFIDQLVLHVTSLHPRYAWIQVLWTRSSEAARALRWARADWEAELRTRTGKGLESSVAGAHEELAARGPVIVSVRGALAGLREDNVHFMPVAACADEHDHLAAFPSRDPGFLVAMAARDPMERVVARHISGRRALGEPPAFLVTPDILPQYAALPTVGPFEWAPRIELPEIAAWGAEVREPEPTGPVLRLRAVPRRMDRFDGTELARLAALAAPAPRSIELVVHGDGRGDVLVSGEGTLDVLGSVYGLLDVEPVDPRAQAVEFLRALAASRIESGTSAEE